ncbi:hypothetical protein ACIQJX_07420 [Streptomyces griseoviridis]
MRAPRHPRPLGRACAVLATAVLVALGPAPGATAGPAVRVCGPHDSCAHLKPVDLTAGRATLDVGRLTLRNLNARALDPASGKPVRGVAVRFTTTDGRFLAEARTGRDGVAAVDARERVGPRAARELTHGYDAALVGDGVHDPAVAHGSVTLATGR